VAESSGVRLALHPNDPPLDEIAGVPCLIRSDADYRRAFDTAGSDALGMEFCVGCWLEGGSGFGNILEGIREFGEAGRILIVHFRNVSAPLPQFVETFVDDGYGDMPAVMQALASVGYEGTAIYDHSPRLNPCAGAAAGSAFAIGYMKGLLAS
jgi:mannonate dehydratase